MIVDINIFNYVCWEGIVDGGGCEWDFIINVVNIWI